jgi:hypothetical protein
VDLDGAVAAGGADEFLAAPTGSRSIHPVMARARRTRRSGGPGWSRVCGVGGAGGGRAIIRYLSTEPSADPLAGALQDPYTGASIAFRRGQATSSMVQIDHIVALGNAWETGASNCRPSVAETSRTIH